MERPKKKVKVKTFVFKLPEGTTEAEKNAIEQAALEWTRGYGGTPGQPRVASLLLRLPQLLDFVRDLQRLASLAPCSVATELAALKKSPLWLKLQV